MSTIERMIQGPDAVAGADYDDEDEQEEAEKLAKALENRAEKYRRAGPLIARRA